MNRVNRHILFLLAVIVLVAIPTSIVFAKELGLLTVSGPGIKGELALKDPNETMKLQQSGFFDQTAFVKPPENLNLKAGYNITAHLNLDGKMVPFVQMVYYPMDKDQPGYVHYTGRLNGETLQTVDQWNILSKSADAAFRGLMAANHITLQSAVMPAPEAAARAAEPAVAASAPTVPSPSAQPPYAMLAAIAAILLLAGTGIALRRRSASHPTL